MNVDPSRGKGLHDVTGGPGVVEMHMGEQDVAEITWPDPQPLQLLPKPGEGRSGAGIDHGRLVAQEHICGDGTFESEVAQVDTLAMSHAVLP
jgi:hypothetical protein